MQTKTLHDLCLSHDVTREAYPMLAGFIRSQWLIYARFRRAAAAVLPLLLTH